MKQEIHFKNSNSKKIVYVDIDETICFYDSDRIYEEAKPDYENIKKINDLYDSGCEITYFTSRGSSQPKNKRRTNYLFNMTKSQLEKWGAKFHNLKLQKPFYDVIIDDKAKRIEEL